MKFISNLMLSDASIPVPQMQFNHITIFIVSTQLHFFESFYITSVAAYATTALWKCFCIVVEYLEHWIYDSLKNNMRNNLKIYKN